VLRFLLSRGVAGTGMLDNLGGGGGSVVDDTVF